MGVGKSSHCLLGAACFKAQSFGRFKGIPLADVPVKRHGRLAGFCTTYVMLQKLDAVLMRACIVKVAKQQGEYIAKLLASGKAQPGQPIQGAKPFR